jgi:hypothetical protein
VRGAKFYLDTDGIFDVAHGDSDKFEEALKDVAEALGFSTYQDYVDASDETPKLVEEAWRKYLGTL